MAEKPNEPNPQPSKDLGKKMEVGGKSEVSQENYVEKKSVHEKRKLDDAIKKISQVKTKNESNKQDIEDKEYAQEFIEKSMESFDFGPGKNKDTGPKNTKQETENFVESPEHKEMKKNIQKVESEYREQLKKTYVTEMEEIKGESKDIQGNKMGQYLETYMKDLKIDPKNITEDDLKNLKETLPDAYREALLNPNMQVGEKFSQVRDAIIHKAQEIVQSKDYKNNEEYTDALRKKSFELAGIHVEQEKFPNSDEYPTNEAYQTAVQNYQETIKNTYGADSSEYSGAMSGGADYAPMTPSENFNPSGESGGEVLPKGENFKEWMEKSGPAEWRDVAKEFLEKAGNNEVDTNTPVLLARSGSNRAIFLHKGKWQEFPVIFGSRGFGNGKGETPVKQIAKFHSVKMASSPQGDASLTGSNTVKGASLLSELGSSQGGKWWHGVNPNRLNGGHTLGCVGLDPTLAMQFAEAVKASGNKGYGYVS